MEAMRRDASAAMAPHFAGIARHAQHLRLPFALRISEDFQPLPPRPALLDH